MGRFFSMDNKFFTFMNKLDRDANEPLSLLEELENALGLPSVAVTWPIGNGAYFEGVYDRLKKCCSFI